MLHALIMAGGSGSRFWPLSRERLPKQFLQLFGERSLLQQAFDRLGGLVGNDHVWIATNHLQAGKTREQVPTLGNDRLIAEPMGRDTAACVAVSAALLQSLDPDARMVVTPADHLIGSVDLFHRAINAANDFLDQAPQALLTLGIPATRPATEYGYLHQGERVAIVNGIAIHKLKEFHEKPDRATAERFVADGSFFFNAGIFCWRASTILDEIRSSSPPLHDAAQRIAAAWTTNRRQDVFESEFEKLPKISIDFAVMEKSRHVHMIEAPFPWDDVGSWLALERVLKGDSSGNVTVGDVLTMRTRECVVVGHPGHMVSTLGVNNLIIVQTPTATLVADRNEEQSVKALLAKLAELGRTDLL